MMKGLWMVLAFFFTKIYLFIFLTCECFPYMYAARVLFASAETRRGHRVPWNRSYGWL